MIRRLPAILSAAAATAGPGLAAAQPAPAPPPPYVYYVVPCGSPGAIVATPAAAPVDAAGAPFEAPVCLAPVATGAAPPPRPRYTSYAYDPWGPAYYARPYYGSFGLSIISGGHHGGGHFGGSHFGGGHGGFGHFGGGHGGGHGH